MSNLEKKVLSWYNSSLTTIQNEGRISADLDEFMEIPKEKHEQLKISLKIYHIIKNMLGDDKSISSKLYIRLNCSDKKIIKVPSHFDDVAESITFSPPMFILEKKDCIGEDNFVSNQDEFYSIEVSLGSIGLSDKNYKLYYITYKLQQSEAEEWVRILELVSKN